MSLPKKEVLISTEFLQGKCWSRNQLQIREVSYVLPNMKVLQFSVLHSKNLPLIATRDFVNDLA